MCVPQRQHKCILQHIRKSTFKKGNLDIKHKIKFLHLDLYILNVYIYIDLCWALTGLLLYLYDFLGQNGFSKIKYISFNDTIATSLKRVTCIHLCVGLYSCIFPQKQH